MDSNKIKKARLLIQSKPYLVWYTKNYQNLSEESIFEAVLNFGDWDDFIKLQDIFGIKRLHLLFKKAVNKKRSNIRPEAKNYFEKYYRKYA